MGIHNLQTMDSVTTEYTLDLNTGLTQVLTDGTDTYLYGLGRIGEFDGTNWTYPLADALGSVRQLVDGSGAPVMAQNYAPYGDVLESYGAASSNYGFAGEWTDGTGLQYLRARYLNTGIGRFITRDSWGGDYKRPMSLNRWGYVAGNPVNIVDPTGYCGANWGFGADKKTEQCIQIVEAIESAYYVTVYWPGRNNLPNGVPENITCFCIPGICDDNEDLNNVKYKKWTYEEIAALGLAIIMYQDEIGRNALSRMFRGVVIIRGKGLRSTSGKLAAGYYKINNPTFRGSPTITFLDGNLGFNMKIWTLTHEIAHHITTGYGNTALGLEYNYIENDFQRLV